eukprot:gene39094-51452_t
MKKSLTAFAALAVCGLASAQSSVTLFGVVDAAVTYQSATSRDPVTGATIKSSKTSLGNSGYNSSRIGFRGTEDLGGGLAASFWLEAPITNDDGATGISTFSRRSTVSLSGGFGELRLGRDYTPTFWNDTVFDPFGTNGSGTNVISTVSGNTTINNANYVRASNSVGYFLPPNLGGFYGQVQYAFNEKTQTSPGVLTPAATDTRSGRFVGGRFGYDRGPLNVALALSRNTLLSDYLTGTTLRQDTVNLGAAYDLGVAKLFGEVSRIKNRTIVTGLAASTASDLDLSGLMFGVNVPVGPGVIRASYAKVRYDYHRPFNTTPDPKARQLALSYVHNLSKRTALYASVARIDNRNGAALSVGAARPATTSGFAMPSDSMRTPTNGCPLRIAVIGAGAIGGWLGVALAQAGHPVSLVARGATLECLQRRGWVLEQQGQRQATPVRAVADAGQLGVQDVVLIAVKAYALIDILPLVRPLIGPDTLVVPALNGVPWWFTQGAAAPLERSDPDGAITAALPTRQVLGAVVYPACSSPEP